MNDPILNNRQRAILAAAAVSPPQGSNDNPGATLQALIAKTDPATILRLLGTDAVNDAIAKLKMKPYAPTSNTQSASARGLPPAELAELRRSMSNVRCSTGVRPHVNAEGHFELPTVAPSEWRKRNGMPSRLEGNR
jgi:hypothetical protein